MVTTPERMTYTVEECAAALGIGRSLCYEMLRQSRIPAIRLGGKWLISKNGVRGSGALPMQRVNDSDPNS